jgi:NodT family efflux transporter outer membrane factor (OMF) lipoprotein
LSLALASLLSACAVGPEFARPAPPSVTSYLPIGATAADMNAEMRLESGAEVSATWWQGFGSMELNQLVTDALAANADLQSAQAALRAANETALAARGAYWPIAALATSTTKQKVAGELSSPLASTASPYRLHTVELDIAYAPDLFGLTRRQAESAEAQAAVQGFQRDALRVSVASNVVASAVGEASLAAQVRLAEAVVCDNEQLLNLVERQVSEGALPGAALLAQQTAVLQARSQFEQLQRQLALTRDALRALLGRLPGDAPPATLAFDSLRVPQKIPVSLPSRLVARRPDILSAEANLHFAAAQAGEAVAARLPQITLVGSAGQSGTALSSLLSAPNAFWALGASVSQALFQGGALRHRQRAAEELLDAAKAQYRSTVIAAFQNVADALQALRHDQALDAQARAAAGLARRAHEIAQRQFELGDISRPGLLQLEIASRQATMASLQTRASLLIDVAALNQALGGGVIPVSSTQESNDYQTKKS